MFGLAHFGKNIFLLFLLASWVSFWKKHLIFIIKLYLSVGILQFVRLIWTFKCHLDQLRCLKFHLQVKQKRSSANKSSTDKQSNAGSNDDSIRAAILDEATIVYISSFKLNAKENAKNNVIFSLFSLCSAGILHPQL